MIITDTAVHPLEYFDEYFSQVYTPREVSAQSFAADVAAGLWTYNGDVVLANVESLVFRYYTPDNVLIKSESVSIVSDGKNAVVMTSESTPAGSYVGQLGMYAGHFYQWNGSEWVLQDTATTADIVDYTPKYLGMFESYPSGAHAGDWCVLSGDGILYLYNGASWQAITDYSNSEYTRLFMAAMSDLCGLAKSTGEQLFVARLVALTAFIQTLFSNQIVIPTGGTISSESYSSGTSGFKIQGNGAAEFNQGTFNNITVNEGVFNSLKITASDNILEYSARFSDSVSNAFSYFHVKTGAQMFGAIAFNVSSIDGGSVNGLGIAMPTSFEITSSKISFVGIIFFIGEIFGNYNASGLGEIYMNSGDSVGYGSIDSTTFTFSRISADLKY